MEIKDYIFIGITILTNSIVWVIQQQRIKSLKEQLELRNIDEIKKWMEIRIENLKMEHKKQWEEALKRFDEQETMRETLEKYVSRMKELTDRYQGEK